MLATAWLIGDRAESIMNDLTAPDGYPPAEVWIPMDSLQAGHPTRLPTFRSARATCSRNGEEWVDFAMPGASIAAALGPAALADPKTLTHGRALTSNLRERDGLLEVKVPRFYSTVCREWFPPTSECPGLVTMKNTFTVWSIASRVDASRSLRTPPDLIITDSGPRLWDAQRAGYYNAGGAIHLEQELSGLPPATPVRCVQYFRETQGAML